MRSRLGLGTLVVALSAAASAVGAIGDAGGVTSATHGSRLLVAAGGGYGLALTDDRGNVLRVLSKAHYSIWGLWSPDDASIAWKDPSGIHVENADGSRPRLLVPTRDSNVTFLWSPNSRSLIVGAAASKQNELWLVPTGGGARRVLFKASRVGVLPQPQFWTPGGDLVFGEDGTGPTYFGSAVAELSVSTGRTRVLWSSEHYGANAPIMSPNLREWAYIGQAGRRAQLRILDKATGKSHIVKGINPTNLVAWSPDSRSFAVIESGWRVVTLAPDGTLQHTIGAGYTIFWGRGGELFVLQGPYDQVWESRNGEPERLLFQLPGHEVISLAGN